MSTPGRPIDAPARAKILARLAVVSFATAPVIAHALGMRVRTVREHLRQMELVGQVFKLTTSMPVYWSDTPPEVDEQGEAADPLLGVKQIIRPIGTWRVERIPTVASVFQLGAA